ncbi:MAG: hypothetical protein QXT68_00455 [Halobacteria archaeon]
MEPLLSRLRAVPHLPARAVLILSALGFTVALGGLWWDGAWHRTFPFEEFWSPPHLVLYAGVLVALSAASGALLEPVRRAFNGPAFPLPPLSVRFPVGLLLLALGTLMALFSGMVDSVWHERLKGGESAYSLPHNLTISGGLLAALGILSGALLLRDKTDLDRRVLDFGILAFGAGLAAGLIRYVGSFAVTRADYIASLSNPALQADLPALALRRTTVEWNWTADNPLWAPLAITLALATPLAMAQALRPRRWSATLSLALLLGGLLAFTAAILAVGQNPSYRFTLAFGLPLAILADFGERLRARSPAPGAGEPEAPLPFRRGLPLWALAGLSLGLLHNALYGWSFPGLLLAAGGGALGFAAARGLVRLILRPSPAVLVAGLSLLAAVLPVAAGGLDIWIRYGSYWWLFG